MGNDTSTNQTSPVTDNSTIYNDTNFLDGDNVAVLQNGTFTVLGNNSLVNSTVN
jgi:hypothetical protein